MTTAAHRPLAYTKSLITSILFLICSPAYTATEEAKSAGNTEPKDKDTILRVQIFLDENNFGPGKLDASMGQFTRKAVAAYNVSHGQAAENWGHVVGEATEAIPNIHTTYEIRQEDLKHIVRNLPSRPKDQVRFRYMGYRSLLEFVAERFHTDPNYISKINKGKTNIRRLKPGSKVIVPNVTPFKIESVEKDKAFEEDPTLSVRQVIVDTKTKQATFHEGGRVVASFPITPGKAKFIHRGDWKLKNMVTTPRFRWDKKMLREGKRSKDYFNIPPGPNSPVGIFWGGISKRGIGLHGTSSPGTIGRSQSAGCIRFSNWNAIRLSSLVRPGATVTIK